MPSKDNADENSNRFQRCKDLFITFFKIGGFTFGGGYAMIPLIQHETVEKHHWISDDDILEIIAIAESTPGPIAINSATFVGFQTAGNMGAFCATLGVALPSFIIISIISYFLKQFESLSVVKYAFNGIRAGVLALLLKALFNMAKKTPKNIISYIIAPLGFIATAFLGINVLYVILGAAVLGLLMSMMLDKKVGR